MKYCADCQKFVPNRHFKDFSGKGHTECKYPGDNIRGDVIKSYREKVGQLAHIIDNKESTIAKYQETIRKWEIYSEKAIEKITNEAAKRIKELEDEIKRLRKRLSRYE